MRAEQSTERSQIQQRMRNVEETLQAKISEIQNLNSRLYSQNHTIQQLQNQLTEENLKSKKINDDTKAFQVQRQQLEIKYQEVCVLLF